MRIVIFAGALASGLAGCGTQTFVGEPPEPGYRYHRDVAPILAEQCVSCHREGGLAPFPLETYAQAYLQRDRIAAAVLDGVMPPWPAAQGCNEYADAAVLDADQVRAIATWADEGGLMGDPSDGVETDPPPPELSRTDLSLSMPETYAPEPDTDDYRCFLLDWSAGERTHVTGFAARPGSPEIVHHVVAYLVKGDRAESFGLRDAADAGPGWTCFGGPGEADDVDTTWLGGWAPGGDGGDFPAGTGVPVPRGARIVLQVHYHAEAGRAATDRTRIDLSVAEEVERPAMFLPFADPAWVFGDDMRIPAGEAEVVHRFRADPTAYVAFVPDAPVEDGKPLLLHSAMLHMHRLGTGGRLSMMRGDADDCLLDVPRWDFGWQRVYGFAEPVRAEVGDEIEIECRWDNSEGVTDVGWGEGTGDEMCLGLFYVTGAG